MFKLTAVLLLLALLVPAAPAAAAPRTYGVSVFVDAKPVSFPDQRPFIDENGRTLVPLRFVAQEMGAAAQWLEADRTVLIEKTQNLVNRTLISLRIGENRARVNDRDVTFDTRPVVVNGRTMVPLRFISETLGANVAWDARTRTASIRTAAAAEPVTPTPFVGTPTRAEDWRTTGGAAALRWRNPTIKYITVADLPHVLDWQNIIGISIDQKYINVTIQGERGTPMLYLAERNDIRRIRNRTNVTAVLGPNVWVQSYDIRDIADTHPDLANIGSHADITKITHFIFRGLANSEERLLAVKNQLYRGR